MSNIRNMNVSSNRKYLGWSPFKTEIEVVLACAEFGNITKAAERVGLSQASLSKILIKVEDSLGSRIFIRSSRGIQLTQVGKEFVLSLKNIRNHWGQYALESGQIENYGLGKISIGTHSSIANSLYPHLIQPLLTEFPQTEFNFNFDRSVEITQKVSRSEIDLGLVVNPIKNADLISKSFMEDHIGLWGKSSLISDTVLYNSDMFWSEKIIKSIHNKRLVEMNDYESISNILKKSSLSALLPASVAARFGFQPQSGKLFSVGLSLIYKKDRFNSKNQRIFIARVLQLLVSK